MSVWLFCTKQSELTFLRWLLQFPPIDRYDSNGRVTLEAVDRNCASCILHFLCQLLFLNLGFIRRHVRNCSSPWCDANRNLSMHGANYLVPNIESFAIKRFNASSKVSKSRIANLTRTDVWFLADRFFKKGLPFTLIAFSDSHLPRSLRGEGNSKTLSSLNVRKS